MDIWVPPPEIAAIWEKPKHQRTKEDSLLVLEWIERAEPVGAKGPEGQEATADAQRHSDSAMRHRPRMEYVLGSVRFIQPADIEDDWSAYTRGRKGDDPRIDPTEFHRAVTDYDPHYRCGRRFGSWLRFCFRRFTIRLERQRNSRGEEQWPDNGSLGFDSPDDRSDSDRLELDTAPEWDRLCAELKVVIGALSDRDRRTIKARYFEGKNNSEIANELGVKKNTAAVIVHRALHRLKSGLIRRGWSEAEILAILSERRPADGQSGEGIEHEPR